MLLEIVIRLEETVVKKNIARTETQAGLYKFSSITRQFFNNFLQ